MSNLTYKQKVIVTKETHNLKKIFSHMSFLNLKFEYSQDKVTSCYDLQDRGNDHLRVIDCVQMCNVEKKARFLKLDIQQN